MPLHERPTPDAEDLATPAYTRTDLHRFAAQLDESLVPSVAALLEAIIGNRATRRQTAAADH